MKAFAELMALTARIDGITKEYGSIYKARAIPAQRVNAIKGLTIELGRHTPDNLIPLMQETTENTRAQLIADAERDGAIERDRVLARLAYDLEAIRAYLPGLAARASIEIGIEARALAAELKGQSDV